MKLLFLFLASLPLFADAIFFANFYGKGSAGAEFTHGSMNAGQWWDIPHAAVGQWHVRVLGFTPRSCIFRLTENGATKKIVFITTCPVDRVEVTGL